MDRSQRSREREIEQATAELEAARNLQRVIGGRAADQAVQEALDKLRAVAGRRRR